MIRARIDPGLKDQAEATFASLGLSASQAITLFYVQVVRHGGLPFAVHAAPRDASATTAWDVLRARAGTMRTPRESRGDHDH